MFLQNRLASELFTYLSHYTLGNLKPGLELDRLRYLLKLDARIDAELGRVSPLHDLITDDQGGRDGQDD